jgi:hypothetical protein
LTWEEFEELTPGLFQELAKRRNVGIRYDRYANALTASAVYNVNRNSEDAPVIAAFDFVRSEEESDKIEQLQVFKRHIKMVIGNLPMTATRTKFLEVRRECLGHLTQSGCKNAEALFDEVWPSLKPTKEEQEGIS